MYHLFVHCALYCVPFAYVYGIDLRLYVIFISHVVIDLMKARYKKIDYIKDQIYHYAFAVIYLYM